MKRTVTIGMLGIAFCCALATAAGRDAQWKRVETAAKKGLPQTAVAILDSIAAGALRDGETAEAIRAIVQRISFEGVIQGNRAEDKIRLLQAELAKANREMHPVMEAILAHWFWEYFQQNRWRFVHRARTAEQPGDDFTTWDLPRIYAEIDLHFRRALAADELLKRTPISEYEELLIRGTAPDHYRPTLYDFVAFEALQFYASGEQAGGQPEDAFALRADSPVFAPAETFMRWRISATDTTSPKLRAVRLYQDLLRFHRDDPDPTARIDADVWRLMFARNHATGEENPARFREAMSRLAERYADHEISTRAIYELARLLHQEGDLVGAWQMARRGVERFPDGIGGRLCANLIADIEHKSFGVATERVWSRPGAPIRVTYRNLDRIHFRLFRIDLDSWLERPHGSLDHLEWFEMDSILSARPVRSWSVALPATEDFKERRERVASPAGLASGPYYLVASTDPRGTRTKGILQGSLIWVSQLALVQRQGVRGGIEGFVLDAESGEPIANAEVQTWTHRPLRGYGPGPKTRTDANGQFRLPKNLGSPSVVVARDGREVVAGAGDLGWYSEQPRPVQRQILFFTDRAIYRPGQTIQYKGLAIEVDVERDRYEVLQNHGVKVAFVDPNGKEIETREHRANDYGSFSGTFTAPRGRLLGAMSIVARAGGDGSAMVSVEEYKRPKFAVTLDAPRDPAKLERDVNVEGRALAYTGAPVDGARVSWRVTRAVQYPVWWGWRHGGIFPPPGPAQEIAHGETITDAEGLFDLTFPARPDLAADRKGSPVFTFAVQADVTDLAGETRSAGRSVRVGYTSLAATLTADSWQVDDRPVEIAVRTTSLDGEPRPAVGELVVRRLSPPAKVSLPEGSPREEAEPREFDLDEIWIESGGRPSVDLGRWPEGDVVFRARVLTDTSGLASIRVPLEAGAYRARLETGDAFNQPVAAELPLHVLDPGARRLGLRVPDLLEAPQWSVEPGQEFVAVWGTGYERARAFVEIEHRGKIVQSYWTEPGRTQQLIRQQVGESMRGGFMLRVTMVRENKAFFHSRRVDVPWTNKRLAIRWEHMVSHLTPGREETWTAVVTGPGASRAAAEMVATLYDASLDAFRGHGWPASLQIFRQEWREANTRLENGPVSLIWISGGLAVPHRDATLTYPRFAVGLLEHPFRMRAFYRDGGGIGVDVQSEAPTDVKSSSTRQLLGSAEEMHAGGGRAGDVAYLYSSVEVGNRPALQSRGDQSTALPPSSDLDRVISRRQLQETAFFFPHIRVENGEVRLEFTMPEALTRWRFLGFAHDRSLRSGLLEGSAVTSKDLMVQPNPPRFLREGDVLEFTVKVTNTSLVRQTGSVRLSLTDALTGSSADAALGNVRPEAGLDVPAGGSRTFAWRLSVPDGAGVLTYKAVASTGSLSDGEEGFVPVLSRRVLVTESLSLPIRGRQTRTFDFARLRESDASPSLRHQSLTVQMVSNPAWYAVMALPYLMEYPYECSEQVFNRLYANSLGQHITRSDPRIAKIFERWRGGPALDSPLEKNEDLKAVALEETPWLRRGQAESQSRRNVGILFDRARLESETSRALTRLADLQLENGAWPWFPGGRPNDYITLYITTGFGRLRHLGADVPIDLALRALDHLDAWSEMTYRAILREGDAKANHLTPSIALYLYGRSFFLKERQVSPQRQEALDYWLGQARKYWLDLPSRQSQAHLALGLQRFGELRLAREIMRSLRERAVRNDELGMFWRDEELSWWWHRAPIESQAMMIEAFAEVMEDSVAVEECRVWLLKQKQTQDWKTTKATADAVYALLLRGRDVLGSRALVEVSLDGIPIEPETVEAGTGFYERRFSAAEIAPRMAQVTVHKSDPGVAWGSVHWQYLEDMSKLTAHSGTPLRLRKTLFVRTPSKQGPRLEPLTGSLRVGQELIVRLELRTDRDMEYVHLKDYRGSGVEPVNVLSGYRDQDGLAYYEMTRDVASHFFIDYLPKGTYVFEYAARVQHSGRYQTGMAQIQCMYAPEFNSHSESLVLDVR